MNEHELQRQAKHRLAALGEMYDRYTALLDTRPSVVRIEVVRGDVEGTLRAIETVLGARS